MASSLTRSTVTRLYKDILRQHRFALPPKHRELGDRYVRSVFVTGLQQLALKRKTVRVRVYTWYTCAVMKRKNVCTAVVILDLHLQPVRPVSIMVWTNFPLLLCTNSRLTYLVALPEQQQHSVQSVESLSDVR